MLAVAVADGEEDGAAGEEDGAAGGEDADGDVLAGGAADDGDVLADGEDAEGDVLADGEDAEGDVLADGEDDGDVLPEGDADGEDDGDVLPEGDADAEDDGDDGGDAGGDVLGAEGAVVGPAVGELPSDELTDGLRKLDADGLRNAFGAIEADGAVADGAVADGVPEVADAADAGAGAVAATPAPACGWVRGAVGVRSAPIMAKAATAEATTSPPARHAEASGREMRCRPGRPRRRGGG